jgi:DNA polymerase
MNKDKRWRYYLHTLGIPLWVSRQSLIIQPALVVTAPTYPSTDGNTMEYFNKREESAVNSYRIDPITSQNTVDSRVTDIFNMSWIELGEAVTTCTACELCNSRTQTVFGVGDRNADWIVVGEAPGADEDLQGKPFVGRAGKLLDPMLKAIGLERDTVFIANILKCRPPKNRDPSMFEASRCRPFLERQIALIKPKIILAVGRVAAQNLLNTDTQISNLRGHVHKFGTANIPVVVTYHPAYLLRSPSEKRKSWEDLRIARRAFLLNTIDTVSQI